MVIFICPGPLCTETERKRAQLSDHSYDPAPGTPPSTLPNELPGPMSLGSSYGRSFSHAPDSLGTGLGLSPWARSIRDSPVFNDPYGLSKSHAHGASGSFGTGLGLSLQTSSIHDRPVLNFSGAPMFHIDKEGMIINKQIINERRKTIENGLMNSVKGIIVHQTGGATAQSSLDSYKIKGENGAHFLIDKNGTIYQTASIKQRTAHVGKLKSRCVFELKCQQPKKFNPSKMHQTEKNKSVPNRYPSNDDAIGIELVGQAFPTGKRSPAGKEIYEYEKITDAQNNSLEWLISGLWSALQFPHSEVFPHDQVSYRTGHEGTSARIFQAPQNPQK